MPVNHYLIWMKHYIIVTVNNLSIWFCGWYLTRVECQVHSLPHDSLLYRLNVFWKSSLKRVFFAAYELSYVSPTAGRITLIVSSTLSSHEGHFIMAGAQSKQQTRCRQGKKTTPLSRSWQTWHISNFIRLKYSSWSTWMSVKSTS